MSEGIGHIDTTYDNNGSGDSRQYSSVYYDNDKLSLYHDNIRFKDGASVLKVKWAGTEGQKCSVVHKRTSFTLGNCSVKEKLEMDWNHIGLFFRGSIKLSDLVRRSTYTAFNLDNNIKATTNAILKLVDKQKLKPSVQVHHKRVVFQNDSQTGIQIHLDTDITICKEKGEDKNRWCTDIKKGDSFILPIALLTVRIPDGTAEPDWLKALTGSSYVVPANGFTKALHATCKLHTMKCKLLPSWYSRTIAHKAGHPFQNWYRNDLGIQELEGVAQLGEKWNPVHFTGRNITFNKEQLDKFMSKGKPQEGVTLDLVDDIEASVAFSDSESSDITKDVSQPLLHEFASDSLPPIQAVVYEVPVPPITVLHKKDENITFQKKTSLFLPNTTNPEPQEPQKNKFLSLFSHHKKNQTTDLTPVLATIRVEPKTYFANERTLLQWLNMCIFLALASFALLKWVGDTPRQLAVSVLVLAILFALYALATYHYRRHSIVSRSVSGHYDDSFGPTVLVLMLLLYVFASVVLSLYYVPVNNVGVPQTNREYHLPLSSTFLASPTLTTGDLSQLKSDIQSLTTKYTLKGSFQSKSNQTLVWYDTRHTCLLYANGYLLKFMEIGNPGFFVNNGALEFMTPDVDYIKQFDNYFPVGSHNATEILRPGNSFLYGREKVIPVTSNSSISTLQTLYNSFSNLFYLSDWIHPVNSGQAVDAVNPQPLKMFSYGDINVNFGTTSTRLGFIEIQLWYSPSSPIPVWGELVLSFSIKVSQPLTKQQLLDATSFYSLLGSMAKYVDKTKGSNTVVDLVYAQNGFCK